jgi:hypothetical protein
MTVVAADARRMADDPARYFHGIGYEAQHMPRDEIAALQLSGLQQRFADLRNRLPVLQAMADEQRIGAIGELDEVVPLLFPHTIYKSYPTSLLDGDRYDRLTQWLGRLTTCDLSKADISKCDGIDSWLDALERDTQVRVLHSSGTTGTMTFLPRAQAEYETFFRTQRMNVSEFVDPLNQRDHADEHFDVVWGTYSQGRSGQIATVDFFRDQLAGSADRFHPLIRGRMSADVMYLAARLKAATARGEAANLKINPRLLARRAEIEETRRASKLAWSEMFDTVIGRLAGKRVFIMIQMVAMHEMAEEGLRRNLRRTFDPGSVVHTGGGTKGVKLPCDWEDGVREFVGTPRIGFSYGMTEVNMAAYVCEHGRHHIPPWVVTFLLNPDTGLPLPRVGVQRGRAAFFDLIPQTYWGGFITGDEVTVHWDPCECGRTTVHMDRDVQRFSEKRGGDDKITCAAAEDAHQAALDLLQQYPS